MIGRIYIIIAVTICMVGVISAFAPLSNSRSQITYPFQQARVVVVVVPSFTSLLSSTEPESETNTPTKSVSADGTFYDDEVEPTPKLGVSDSMKERLRQEASTGLDADKPQSNVILYIIAAVSILVLLGGKDIFY